MNEVEIKNELRDTLSEDWPNFFAETFPSTELVPILNTGGTTDVDALILSGGNDVGSSERRDAMETDLLNYCVREDIPVLGVCRGMQFIQHWLGGKLDRIEDGSHAGTVHSVRFDNLESREVNSYHNYCIPADDLHSLLTPVAWDDQGNIEAYRCEKFRIAGIMWHPERYDEPVDFDVSLIQRLFEI